MTYDRKNYGGIQGYDQKTPRITSQQFQDNPSVEYKANSTNQLFKKTYYPNSEPVEGFAVEDSYSIPIEDLGSVYGLHQLVIQFSMMLKSSGTEIPKYVQAVRVIHTRDRMNTSLETLKITEESKAKKIAESSYTLCFFWDATIATMGKIPKNALVQLFFVDNKREFGLIWSANFVQLGNHTGTPNPTLDKFNGTTITNYGSPGAAVGAPIGSYTNGSANHGSCNPHSNPIVPDSFIFCGIPSEKERKIKVHPNAPVLNYNSVGFTENGYKRFAASDPVIAPKIMVTHWDVCHNTKSMFDTLIKRGISMGFGVDRDGLIVQMANAGQARFGALGFSEGTVQCEVNNPVEDKPHVLDYNRRCFNGDENGGRRRIPNNFKFPNGATLGYEYIFDFTDPQYFSIGALWEAVGHAYNIPLVIPDDSWIDYRPGDVTDGRVHAFRGATTPEQAKRDIKNHYSGIVFHHNIDWANRGGRVQSGKIDIILLDRKRILSHALQCRADRNAGKF